MYEENNDIELQNDQVIEQHDDAQYEVEDQDQQLGSDSEPDSEPGHEENSDDVVSKSVNQESVNDAIAKQHAKYREEQRRREAAERRLAELEHSQGSQADPEPQIVEIDPYGDDVEDQIKQRDESLRAHIAWQQRQYYRQAQQQQYQQQTYTQQQQQSAQQAEKFFDTAKKDGIKQEELHQAVQAVGQYQLGHEVASYLMSDDKGHRVTLALAKNPALLADLAFMQPHERILHIERNVRSKVANTAPRRSKGKQPPTRAQGGAPSAGNKFPLTGGKVKIE